MKRSEHCVLAMPVTHVTCATCTPFATRATVACPVESGGTISVDEGLAHVGPIALDLQPYPQVTGPGAVTWTHTYRLSSDDLYNITPLTGHVVVLHGLTSNGTYNRATFVACGQIQAF